MPGVLGDGSMFIECEAGNRILVECNMQLGQEDTWRSIFFRVYWNGGMNRAPGGVRNSGGNGANTPTTLETFELYGCYVESANYNQLAYSAGTEPVTVTLNIRYDNAVQTPQGTGIGTAIGRTVNTLVTGAGA